MKYTSPFADIFKEKKPQKGTRVRFEIALDSIRDKEIIDHLNTLPNKSEYVRDLIKEDIDA